MKGDAPPIPIAKARGFRGAKIGMADVVTAKTVKRIMFVAIACELAAPLFLDGDPTHLSQFLPVYYCICVLATAVILVCYRKTPKTTRETDEVKALALSCITAAYGLANIAAHLGVLSANAAA